MENERMWNISLWKVPFKCAFAEDATQKTWWAIWGSRMKINWMMLHNLVILVPEYSVGKASNELIAARRGMVLAVLHK